MLGADQSTHRDGYHMSFPDGCKADLQMMAHKERDQGSAVWYIILCMASQLSQLHAAAFPAAAKPLLPCEANALPLQARKPAA